jgi:ribokinase
MDLVVKVARQPSPGETVLGGDLATYPGGKGANQAVAAARAGGVVQMVGLVGDDTFGPQLRANLQSCGVDTRHLGTCDGPSGVALITVDEQGQNMIVVSPGANGSVTPEHVPLEVLRGAALVVLQLEIPLDTVRYVIREAGVPVLLNPAPAQPVPLDGIRYLVLNETEAALLSGVSEPRAAARALRAKGVGTVIVTLGGEGVCWLDAAGEGSLPAHRVKVVDTTAAGDAFCGALAVRLAEGAPLVDAVRFANAAGAVAVTRAGAQPGLGTRAEIEALLLL